MSEVDPAQTGRDPYPHAIPFTARQRRELKKLGVPDLAIRVIEVEALPRARRLLRKPARMSDVRDELRQVEGAIKAARQAIDRLLSDSDASPILRDAQRAIGGNSDRVHSDRIMLKRASEALAPALEAMTFAVENLSKSPTRYKAASPLPVELIHDALEKGCWYSDMPFEPRKGKRHAGLPAVAPHLQPSASPTSAFRKIVGLCYEQLGMEAADPERAITAYLKRHNASADDMAAQIRRTEPPATT